MRINSTHTKEDRDLDAYFTPREAVVSLTKIEGSRLPRIIWEPACGNGAIVIPLREAGYDVRASDIKYYGFSCVIANYFSIEPHSHCGGIVTNPPFKLAVDFAKKALSEVPYLALLLRTNFLESQDRLPFFRQYPPARIWISSRRLPGMHRYGWTGPKAPSNVCYAWFIWDDRLRQKQMIDWFDWADFNEASPKRSMSELVDL